MCIEANFKLESFLSFWHIEGWYQTDPVITQEVSLYFDHGGCFPAWFFALSHLPLCVQTRHEAVSWAGNTYLERLKTAD